MFLYFLLYPIAIFLYKNKRPYILCERGDDARDNAYWMFKYLRKEHTYINAIYLINKKSADYRKVSELGKVVQYKSLKHWLLYIAAECRMTTHLASFAPANYLGEWFKHHRQNGVNVFLQHGITHNEFPSNYYDYNGSDLFVCGAKPEFNHISQNCNYPNGNVVYTGFARFDGLHDFSIKRQIIVMPSWRCYLSDVSSKEFYESKYFKEYKSFLTNEKLVEKCKNEGISIIFYPHYSMQKFINCFKTLQNDVVKIADFNSYDVQTLLKESSLLITDYSSVLFDFAYMRKPQLLFQFDEDEFYEKHYKKSYFDHKRDGFGKVVQNSNCLVSEIFNLVESNFIIEDQYLKKIDSFFPLNDVFNSERIYQTILSKFIEKNKSTKIPSSTKIIVTGDDYGRNFESSEGIRRAFIKQYIQYASVIVNKDERNNLDVNGVDINNCGLHINFLEGYASFGDVSKYLYSINDKNSFASKVLSKKTSFIKLSPESVKIIQLETKGQIEAYKRNGFLCNHFDSHGHIHHKYPIAKVIIPIMKQYGFESTRIPMNIEKNSLMLKKIYKLLVRKLYTKNFKTTDFFSSPYEFIHIRNFNKYKNKTIEIMTHPYYNKDVGLINRRDVSFENLYKIINK